MITCSLHLQVAEFIVSCQRSEYMLDMGKTLGLVLVSQDLLVSVLILHNNSVCPKSPVMCQHTLCSQENDL